MSIQMDVDGESSGAPGDMDDLEKYAFENESCGICRDIIIDRGVLDCCQHWFCYTCIDNWSAITNRCPLCKSQFQHITCTPVYDTSGANNDDEYSLTSGDDDWFVQGENTTLSFPSYYIDAEAVVCLDDGDCKIRSGLVSVEDDSTFDTSIACDSCDLWYHAICVGFNPEIASEDSWLCPRCVSTEVKHKVDSILKPNFSGDFSSGSDRTTTDASFSGRVSVSVADEGETALVVSMVGVHPEIQDGLSGPSLGLKTEQEGFNSNSYQSYSKKNLLSEAVPEQGNMSDVQLEVPYHAPSCSFSQSTKKTENSGEENERCTVIKPPHLSSPARSNNIEMIDAGEVQQMSTPDRQLPTLGESMSDMEVGKYKESGDEIGRPSKRARSEVREQEMNLIENSGEDYKRDPGRELARPVGRRAGDKPGLRVKKIFRKEEGKKSSAVVQKLQQEIREVVRDTGTTILEKENAFDEKLLTAFRAAIGKSADEQAGRNNPSLIKTRRALLQKGKTRENLTKKLYGSSGRRRSAWHRDWEVEFWKHRCSPGVNPEKIETLQSVLQLLKKSSEMDKDIARDKKGVDTNSILSRVYLADASVVPRKDDVKPLSALAGSPPLEQNSQARANNSKAPNKPTPGTETIKISSPSSTGRVSSSSILSKEASSRRENKNIQAASNQQNQSTGDIKHDKRKWALEVLARKNASSITSKDKCEVADDLKGNYPLLAQLPVDMRPQLTTSRHNKVPISIRQAQLYHIAEHYLQKANLAVIRRCADTELAIADAVNVEKDISERSSSKLVYVNLCSQATRQSAKGKSENDAPNLIEKSELDNGLIPQQVSTEDTTICNSATEEALNRTGSSDLPASSGQTVKSEVGKDLVPEQTVGFSNVEEALKMAGLLDSPPNSPDRKNTTIVDLDSEHSKNLQSTSDSMVRDISSPKDADDPSLLIDLHGENGQNLHTVTSHQQSNHNTDEHLKSMLRGETTDATANKIVSVNLDKVGCGAQCGNSNESNKEILANMNKPDEGAGQVIKVPGSELGNQSCQVNSILTEEKMVSKNSDTTEERSFRDNAVLNSRLSDGDKLPIHAAQSGDDSKKPSRDPDNNKSDSSGSIYKKVEVFVKENIRPLCKSGVITVEQYRWAVAKTTDKVVKYHSDAKNANFLIKQGDKVKKLALQYVEAAQQKVT
uniref:RING-type domain-containing protein n=1 Tax=Leersia perrieri TaxID=77586 RepID=A0A0D9V511_9ORYZ